jgi:hypothetical protein
LATYVRLALAMVACSCDRATPRPRNW